MGSFCNILFSCYSVISIFSCVLMSTSCLTLSIHSADALCLVSSLQISVHYALASSLFGSFFSFNLLIKLTLVYFKKPILFQLLDSFFVPSYFHYTFNSFLSYSIFLLKISPRTGFHHFSFLVLL